MTYIRYSRLGQTRPAKTDNYRRRRIINRLIISITILLVGFIGFKIDLQVKAADHAAALAAEAHLKAEQQDFAQAVDAAISSNPDITFSVSLVDLNHSFSQQFGVSDAMEAASVGKIVTAALYLHETENGQYSLGQSVGGDPASTGLQQMVQQSDDTAWQNFNDLLGHDALRAYAQANGMPSYNPDADTVKAGDIATLLEKIYDGKLLSRRNTNLLLSYMRNTNYEDFITPALTAGYQINHKVGLVDDNVNDAAVISGHGKSIVLVIFTDGHGVQQWQQRAALMQQIARAAIKDYL